MRRKRKTNIFRNDVRKIHKEVKEGKKNNEVNKFVKNLLIP